MKPQTIQIFLPDGSPNGIKEAELTNRLIKVILFPRTAMESAVKRYLDACPALCLDNETMISQRSNVGQAFFGFDFCGFNNQSLLPNSKAFLSIIFPLINNVFKINDL